MLVLFMNDACDVSVDVLKMANFLTLDGLKGYFIVEIAFFQMLFFHFYWRLWEGPRRVLYSAYWRAHEMTVFRQSNIVVAMDHRHVLMRLENNKLPGGNETGITYSCLERECDESVVTKLINVYLHESREIEALNDPTDPAAIAERWTADQLPYPSNSTFNSTASIVFWDDAKAVVAANVDKDLFPSRHTGGPLSGIGPYEPW